MNQNLLSRVLEFLRRKMWNKRWQRAVTCLAAVAVFGVTYALILPAITLTGPHPEITAEKLTAWSGDELTMHVTAEAVEEEHDKIFVLSMDETGADLAEKYEFSEEGIALIKAKDEAENELELELHRAVRENTKKDQVIVDYWFTVDAGTKVQFDLDLVDEVDEARFSETVEKVNRSAGKDEASDATASNAAAAEEEAAGKASDATVSNAEKASGSNADVAEANAIAKEEEKIVVEKDDDGFEQILDGAVVDDREIEEEDGVKIEITSRLKVSAGNGEDLEEARKDADKSADKRENAQLKFQWKTEVEPEPDMVWSDRGANIAVFYDDDAEIPNDATLSVREIEEGTEEYEQLLAQTKSTVKENAGANQTVKFVRFFDITILDGDENEIEPAAPVKVVITYNEPMPVDKDGDVNVLHFKDEVPEVIKPNTDDSSDVGALSFTTESFSVYAVYGTEVLKVQYLSSDGKTYDITVTAGPEAGIPTGSSLVVTEYEAGSEVYEKAKALVEGSRVVYRVAVDETQSEGGEVIEFVVEDDELGQRLAFAAMDISIIGPDGKKVEPAVPVTMEIKVKEMPEDIPQEKKNDVEILTQHIVESEAGTEVQTLVTADEQKKEAGSGTDAQSKALLQYQVDSFSTFTMTYYFKATSDSEPEERKSTLHYGYMDSDGKFTEFDTQDVTYPTGTGTYFDSNGVINHSVNSVAYLYLIYDVEGYRYKSTYYLPDGAGTGERIDPTEGTRIQPMLVTTGAEQNRRMLYYANYDNTATTITATAETRLANNSDVYLIYEPKPEYTEGGGGTEVQIEEMKLDEPKHEKHLQDNGNGTYTISLDVKGEVKVNEEKSKVDVIIILDRSGSMDALTKDVSGYNSGARWAKYNNLTLYQQYSREAVAVNAANDLAEELLKNNEGGHDYVQVGVVSFGDDTTIHCELTPNLAEVKAGTAELLASHMTTQATNWEAALFTANCMEVRDDAKTYIVFVSDGNPTTRNTRKAKVNNTWNYVLDAGSSPSGTAIASLSYMLQRNVFGNGHESDPNRALCLSAAQPEGDAVVAQDKELYTIGVYGNVNEMNNFMKNSYTDNGKSVPEKHHFNAKDEDELLKAFASIVNDINITFGYANVNIDDGITGYTNLNAKAPVPGLDVSNNFTYKRNGGTGIHVYDNEDWNPAADGCNPATYDTATGSVVWNMGENFTLEDGVTYTVSFVVWPNQASYDLVSRLNSGSTEAYDEDQISYKMVDGKKVYFLNTNKEYPSLTYKQYKKEGPNPITIPEGNPETATPYTNPEPVGLTTTTMKFVKAWNDDLDPAQRPDEDGDGKVDPITFDIKVDNEVVNTVTLSDENHWEYEMFISPGLKVSGVTYNTGHDYTAVEHNVDKHYEMRIETIHPTLIDSNSNITKVGDGGTGAEGPDGYLTAYNDLKSGIEIRKIVRTPDDTEIRPEQLFTITGSIEDSNGQAYSGDNKLYYRIFQATPTDAGFQVYREFTDEQGAAGRSERRPIDDSSNINVSLYPGEVIRIIDIPTGSQYSLEEAAVPEGYYFDSIEGGAEENIQPNHSYQVTVNNRRVQFEIELFKTESGKTIPLRNAEFDLYSSYSDTEKVKAKDIDGIEVPHVTTDEEGKAGLGTLGSGKYYLVETKAPSGYLKIEEPIEITVTKDGVTYVQKDYIGSENGSGIASSSDADNNVTYTLTVTNNPGKELPHTGGPGTALYTLSGMMLLIASALLYGFRRRHEERRAA